MYKGFITYQELVLLGVPESTIKNMCFKFRSKKTKLWENYKVENRLIINLITISKLIRFKYNLPTAEIYEEQKEKQKQIEKKIERQNNVNEINKKLMEALDGYGGYAQDYIELLESKKILKIIS